MAHPRGGLVVLAYHAISSTWPAATTVAPESFEEQLWSLVARGYRSMKFTDAVMSPPAERSVAITFDDASESVYSLALPVMERLGVIGTVFVPTAYPDSGRPLAWPGQDRWLGTEHEHELGCMSWDALAELDARGWEIGSHTRSHPHLPECDDATLVAELQVSREECRERLGRPCRSLAYPYSDYNGRVTRAADAAGYGAAGTVPRGYAPPSLLEWPRVGVYRSDTADRLWARIWLRRSAVRSLRVAGAARLVGKALRH